MSKEVAELSRFKNAIKPIMGYYNKSKYHISYFGGEPLLNWELIEYTLPKFKNDPDCSSVVLISNGLLLTQERVDFLKNYGCGLSWSFDGLWSSKNRPLADGSDSLEEYLKVLPLALQLTNSCKVMVNPYSFDTLSENFDFFINHRIQNPDFCLVRDSIYNETDIQKFKFQARLLADKIIEYNLNGVECSAGFFTLYTLDTLAAKLYGKRNHGCFVGVGGLLYATDGTIWPCERFRSARKMCLYDGYDYNWGDLRFLNSPSVSNPQEYPECKSCGLYEYCNAGCTFSELREGKWLVSRPVKSVCELFRICYAEGLRIYQNAGTKYQDYIHRCLESGG